MVSVPPPLLAPVSEPVEAGPLHAEIEAVRAEAAPRALA